MGKWTDVAPWLGPIVNSGDGDGRELEPEDRMSGHVGVVVHIAEGTYLGTIAWQRNPSADVGSHFVFAKDGRRAQLIDTTDRSWCQSSGNSTWISVENEGYSGQELTPQQIEANAQVLARAHVDYGVPLAVSNSPSTPGLGWHGMGGAAWGGHYDCPGNAIRAQLPAIVARAAQITGGTTDMTPEESATLKHVAALLDATNQGMRQTTDGMPCYNTVRRISDEAWMASMSAAVKADEIRDKALAAALDGLVAAIHAGGGSVDAAPIVAAVAAVRDEARVEFARLHTENADLRAQLAEYQAREAAAARAEADALKG